MVPVPRGVVIAAWLAGAAACSSSDAPALRLLELSRAAGGGCIVRELCPGADCHPAAPYETACPADGEYRMRADGEDPEPAGSRRYARLADGTCRTRPRTCQDRACLGAATACPPPPGAPLPTLRWMVERGADGRTCTVVPEPPTELSAKVAAITAPCDAYDDIHSIERRPDGTCMGLDDFPCPEGARCEPTQQHGPLPCPTR